MTTTRGGRRISHDVHETATNKKPLRRPVLRGGRLISYDTPETADLSTSAPVQRVSLLDKQPPRRRRSWGGRTFSFNLDNFSFKGGLATRRFSVVEAAFLLMLAMITSRVLGVVRQVIFNATFGTGLEANAYVASSRLPDTLFTLVAGGALTFAFIPVFQAYEKQGEREVWQLASLVLNMLLVAITIATLIAEFVAPTFVNNILVPGFTPYQRNLTTSLTRIQLLQPLLLGMSTIATGILNSKRQFLLPALAIAVYNVGLIGGLLVTRIVPHIGIYGPTYGVLVACILQILVQVPGLIKQGARYTFYWNLRHPGLLAVLRLLLPSTLAIGVAQIALIVETNFTSKLPDSHSLAALHNAEMLQALPVALIGQAIGNSLLPHLSVHATSGHYVRMRQMAIKVISVSLVLTIPAAIVIALVGKPLIHLLFQHGAFDQHSTDLTNLALIGYAIALPGMCAGSLLASGFYALKDAFTPFFGNTFGLIVRISLIVLLMRLLPTGLSILSIPLALAGAVTLESLAMIGFLLFRLQRRSRQDQGYQRLLRQREYRKSLQTASPPAV